jgi:hypothetical protein
MREMISNGIGDLMKERRIGKNDYLKLNKYNLESINENFSTILAKLEQMIEEQEITFKNLINKNDLAVYKEVCKEIEGVWDNIVQAEGSLIKELNRMDQVDGLRSNAIMGQLDKNGDAVKNLGERLRNIAIDLKNSSKRNEANLFYAVNRIQLDVSNMMNMIVDLQKKVTENSKKIESRNEEEARKERDNEQRSQCKKGKSKMEEKSSSSNDENKDLHRPIKKVENESPDEDIITILRNKKKFWVTNCMQSNT